MAQSNEIQRVAVIDLDLPLIDMVFLLVKLAIAAIPAAVIVVIVYLAIITVFGGIFASVGVP